MKKRNKKNFTLVEVAVVLLVLVALAGVTVPLALAYAQRSHGSTGAGNMAALTTSINRFEAEKLALPDGWDNIVNTANDAAYDDAFGIHTLTDEDAEALEHAGIENVYPLSDVDDDAAGDQYSTFNGTGAAVAVAENLVVAAPTAADVQGALGQSLPGDGTYIAFGIGDKLSAIGKTMPSAPYDFPEGAETPGESYRRFIAIFHIPAEEDGHHAKAKFIGVVANDDGKLTNIQDHIAEYYEATE